MEFKKLFLPNLNHYLTQFNEDWSVLGLNVIFYLIFGMYLVALRIKIFLYKSILYLLIVGQPQ